MEDSIDLRQGAESHVSPGACRHDQRCREDEARARHKETRKSSAGVSDVDRHFGRIRSGDKVGGAHQVDELLAREPATSSHHLVFHHGDVRRRPAKADDAEFQEKPREFLQAGRATHLVFRLSCCFTA